MELSLPSHPAVVDALASPDQADSITSAALPTLATSRAVPPAMAPHMTPKELDRALELSKKCTPTERFRVRHQQRPLLSKMCA